MNIRSILELNGQIVGKTVIVRVDFNIPIIDGKIADYSRINASLETIKYLQKQSAKIVLMTHFGRPDGKIDPTLSLSFLIPELTKILQTDVKFSYQHIGHEPKNIIESMKNGDVLLLENIRFDKNEITNDFKFSSELASLADLYVNEAFSASHREHASIVGITHHILSYAGFSFLNEVNNLQIVFSGGNTVAILGGKKTSTKINALKHITQTINKVIISGAMANTFLKARGNNIGHSFYEESFIQDAKNILSNATAEIILPEDFICMNDKGLCSIENMQTITLEDKIFDIGPLSAFAICKVVDTADVVLWNGPLGMFEDKRFACATDMLIRFISSKTQSNTLKSIAGGGDTLAAINQVSLPSCFSYLSMAGGAFLDWLEGKKFPGIDALRLAN